MKAKYFMGALLLSLGFVATSCSDDDDYSVATGNIITSVETGQAAVTATTATLQGTVLNLKDYATSSYTVGMVYGTATDPTTSGKRQMGSLNAETGDVTASIEGLVKGQTYYYATYVTLQGKVTRYGDVRSFTTTDATIVAADAQAVTAVSATLGGTASADAATINVGESQTAYGLKLADSADGVASGRDFALTTGATSFAIDVTGLLPGQTYYYATYFRMGDGLVYSDTKSFQTLTQEMEYVDLGLSVMWAKWNIGAASEAGQGALLGYGDVTGLKTSTYLTQYPDYDVYQSFEDVATYLGEAIDGEASQQSYTPSEAEYQELLQKTTQTFETVDGVPGYRFTARNGNSIFMPIVGYRDGEATQGEGTLGLYWLGEVSPTNSDYAKTINLTANAATLGASQRSMGLAVRSVRPYEPVEAIEVDVAKLRVGDLEGNGRIRIEIYNEYGGTAADPGLNMSQFKFERSLLAKFTITGITDNLKEGAPEQFVAGWEFAAAGWYPSLWSGFSDKYDCRVKGDGTYSMLIEPEAAVDGAVVFCIDIDQLGANLVDPSLVKVENLTLALDADESAYRYYVDNSKVLFNNKDGNGTDGRIEIYNEWGGTKSLGADYSDLKFKNSYMIVSFTISGIDGNLVDGASGAYKTELSFADQWWGCQYWGGVDAAAATVTGDGQYEVWAPLAGDATPGPCVWTIELYGLWADLVDASAVRATINSVTVPGKE